MPGWSIHRRIGDRGGALHHRGVGRSLVADSVTRYALGIDPGKTGALALVPLEGTDARVWEMPPDHVALARLLRMIWRNFHPVIAGIERVNAGPQFGTVGNFTFGVGFGVVQMGVLMLKIPLHLVLPSQWQKSVGGFPARPKVIVPDGLSDAEAKRFRAQASTRHRKAIKAHSRAEAARLFPNLNFSRQKDDGIADALHIGRWAGRQI